MKLDHSFAEELTALASEVKPNKLINSHLVAFNQELATELGLPTEWQEETELFNTLYTQEGLLNRRTVAQKYGGHQFGHWNPELGDGRGLLLAEAIDKQKQRWDLHLKGAGPTPYSRFADGRAVLRSTIREYLASEALFYLGIPTSRALCLITSDEPVYREKQERAAKMIRVCQSHLRFGHFEYFYHSKQPQKLQSLFDYCFKYHFTECAKAESPYLALLEKIVQDTAKLIAKWQAFGFNHGVMNTDNMSIHGITFDYGPYAFLDDFEPTFICNHSDPQGRYSFDSQPGVGLWNLNALAQSFTPYLEIEQIKQALSTYEGILLKEYSTLMHHKLGLVPSAANSETHAQIINVWLDMLAAEKKDYSVTFRQLCQFDILDDNQNLRDQFINRERFDDWAKQYALALSKQGIRQTQRQTQMRHHNPHIMLRNYLAQQVIDRAEEGNFEMFHQFIAALKKPYEEIEEYQKFSAPPPDWGKQLEISCSS
ncbi:YdiU family protein [uncultured Paraglaciecola sp.]|mgnify:CR=1 FL=1|uniref:protein adenylyltransferase SelO n=1 Tax=uncultured Paraglaciecola sp. TaxID=1765024 RepID=UPI0030DBE85D|tara:strand:- start:47481 stop:48932 length:1452 start_codon:yes stop_codon:yes gene_type:complete